MAGDEGGGDDILEEGLSGMPRPVRDGCYTTGTRRHEKGNLLGVQMHGTKNGWKSKL